MFIFQPVPATNLRIPGRSPELDQSLCEFAMVSGVERKRDAGDRRLPGLAHGSDTGGGATGMADDAAAAEIEEIQRAPGTLESLRRLTAPLTRADDRQRTIARREERRLQRFE